MWNFLIKSAKKLSVCLLNTRCVSMLSITSSTKLSACTWWKISLKKVLRIKLNPSPLELLTRFTGRGLLPLLLHIKHHLETCTFNFIKKTQRIIQGHPWRSESISRHARQHLIYRQKRRSKRRKGRRQKKINQSCQIGLVSWSKKLNNRQEKTRQIVEEKDRGKVEEIIIEETKVTNRKIPGRAEIKICRKT